MASCWPQYINNASYSLRAAKIKGNVKFFTDSWQRWTGDIQLGVQVSEQAHFYSDQHYLS